MLEIIPGSSWKLNPTYLEALRRLGGKRSALPSVLDSLGIELDGVNLSRGLSEASLFEAVDELSALAVHLSRDPAGAGQVSLGGAELVLGRHELRVRLSLVALARPARLLAGEIEVELAALQLAVAGCAEALLSDLGEIDPALARTPLASRLARRAKSLRKLAQLPAKKASAISPASPLTPAAVRAPSPSVPSVALNLLDEHDRVAAYRRGADLYSLLFPGEVALQFAEGASHRLGSAPPFLVLTDLSRAAADLIRAAEVGELTWEWPAPLGPLKLALRDGALELAGRTLPCDPHALARAFLQASLDFCGAVCARNRAQARNPYLSTLEEGAREKLAQLAELESGNLFADQPRDRAPRTPRLEPESPLAAGALKKMRFRPSWQGTELGERARAARLTRTSLILAGETRACWIEPRTGARQAIVRSEHLESFDGGVVATVGRKLVGYSDEGAPLFSRDLGERGHSRLSGCCGAMKSRGRDAVACAFEGHTAGLVQLPTGAIAWRYQAPQAVSVSLATAADRLYVAADGGSLYALEPGDGSLAFRVRAGMAFEGPLAVGAGMVCALGRREGALFLLAVDQLSGRPLLTRPLPLESAGAPLVWRRRILVPGLSEGVPSVVALSPSGRELFQYRVERAPGMPALSVCGGRLLLGLRDGGVVCLDGRGRFLWRAGALGLELDRALPPQVRRAVVVAPGDPVRALDLSTGAVVGELPPIQGLSALAVSPSLEVFAVDEDGFASAFVLATHLSLVG